MSGFYSNILETIGNTPLVQIQKINHSSSQILAKVESFNPAGSAKDRIALAMIEDAEELGMIQAGATIIEPTSGNTGIGLALVCAVKGYHLILTMPDTMSIERRKLLAAYGAELVLTPGQEGMAAAIAEANKIKSQIPGSFIPQQFENPSNPACHEMTTAREILRDTDGKIDAFLAGIGTGGTLIGVARGLKHANPAIKIIGMERADSPLITQGKSGPHAIQGIGANFIPKVYEPSVVDEVVTVTNDDAIKTAQDAATKEGLLIGISGGAALHAALQIGKRPEFCGRTIVVLLPDSGERYLSSGLF